MGKYGKKKKGFWGEDDLSADRQLETVDALLKLTRQIEAGEEVPDIDFRDGDLGGSMEFNSELESGLDDAFRRLNAKRKSVPVTMQVDDDFSPLTKITDDEPKKTFKETVPVTDRIETGDELAIRDMEAVPKEDEDRPKMKPVSKTQAEDPVEEEDLGDEDEGEDELPEREMEFSDFDILYVDGDAIILQNAYNRNIATTLYLFYLRGYNVERDKQYEIMEKYIPIMLAMMPGPACTIKADHPTFQKFMRGSVESGINIDKSKIMIFTVGEDDDKYYLIYVLDEHSRSLFMESIWPGVQERKEEIDCFVQFANATLNPMFNPYGMIETDWPEDRASQSTDTDEKIEEFCGIMQRELGIEIPASSKMSYSAAEATFNKKSVIGNIQKFLMSIKTAKEELEKQMNPDNYVETFLEEGDVEEMEEIPEAEETVEESEDTKVKETDDLFEDVGEAVEEPAPTPVVQKQEKKPNKPKKDEQKPAKVEEKPVKEEKKSGTRKFEIPVQKG